MPDYGAEQYVVIYSDLGSEDLNERIFAGYNAKSDAEFFIEELENKAILIKGYLLRTEWYI